MVISCVIYGLGIGGITGLTVVVLVQSLGMEKLTAAFGLNVFIGGLVVFPGIVIIGNSIHLSQKHFFFLINSPWLPDSGYIQVLTNSFAICFHIVGGICVICCAMWAPLPMMLRKRNANLPK